MRTKAIGMIAVTAVLVSVAIAAVALGPMNLANLGSPTGGNTPGNTPESTSIGVPTWHVGDSWTYEVNGSSPLAYSGTYWDSPSIEGSLMRTVASADEAQVNVSVHGSFHVTGLVDFSRDGDFGNATIMVFFQTFMENATVDGYTVYRASDLAALMDVRTVRVTGSISTDHGTFNATYTAKVDTTYDPALDVWSFPLGENETWNVSSNATIHAQVTWRLDAPDEYFEFGRNFTAMVPIRLVARSGMAEDVTTPAGTFSAIPVRFGIATMDAPTTDPQLSPAMGLGDDGFVLPRPAVEAWFSGDVGNVVKAVAPFDGMRVVSELTSFHRS